MMSTWERVIKRIQRKKNSRTASHIRKQLKNSGFSVISQNCIGGVFYSDMQMEFLSPTINLYFPTSDFLRFVIHMKEYLAMDPEMTMGEKYPIGHLGDVQIHFMHYDSCEEAKDKWNERKTRINWEKIVVFCTDMEGFTDFDLELWNMIEYPKVLFTAKECLKDVEGALYFPQYRSDEIVPDLIPKREFYKTGFVLDVVNRI